MDIWRQAVKIAPQLARALAGFETAHRGAHEAGRIEGALVSAWHRVIDDAKQSAVTLEPAYLCSLHSDLDPAYRGRPDVFREGKPPMDWRTFLDAMVICDSIQGAEAWVVAQLCWGEHLPSMSFSTGWLCFNGLRLQEGVCPLSLPVDQWDLIASDLRDGGPPVWDAENLRALIGRLERDQAQKASGYGAKSGSRSR